MIAPTPAYLAGLIEEESGFRGFSTPLGWVNRFHLDDEDIFTYFYNREPSSEELEIVREAITLLRSSPPARNL